VELCDGVNIMVGYLVKHRDTFFFTFIRLRGVVLSLAEGNFTFTLTRDPWCIEPWS